MRTPDDIKLFLSSHKGKLDHPQVYFGDECNTYGEHGEREFFKSWVDSKLRILFSALWRYEDFRGNQTVPLLYYMMNSLDREVLVERSHLPSSEEEYAFFRSHNMPVFSLESKHEMGYFDVIMTSVSFSPPWMNFLLMLRMSGIPIRWKEREERNWPLIMVGGASCYGNFSLMYPVADIIYLGDAETDETGGLMPVVEELKKQKQIGSLKNPEFLEYLQKKHDYLMIPKFFEPQYKEEKFMGWKKILDVNLKTHKVKNLDLEGQYYKKPIPSYTDTTMGLGEVEISRGCRGTCAFCGIGWKYRPYRERSKDFMLKALSENKKYGGAVSMCPIATEFAFYGEKRGLIKEACEKHSRFIDPLSMRIDAFAEDEDLDLLLSQTGMNQLALGVEGPSQRLRNKLMKGISEEQILHACEIAIKSGRFRRIKFFMISNIGETKEDFEEFFCLLDKVNELKFKYHSKINVKASWTPLIVESCVPLQWMRPTIDNKIDLYWWSEQVKSRNVEFALGVKNREEFLWSQQAVAMADTRMAEAIIDASLELDKPYMSIIPVGFQKVLEKHFPKYGLTWDYIMREKDIDEEFVWDLVDRGVSKELLKKTWISIKSGEQEKKCLKFNIKTDKEVDISIINFLDEQKVAQHYLVEYFIDKELDCVPNTYWKAYLHRASYLSGFPLSVNQLSFLSDRSSHNWYWGWDYFKLGVQKMPVNFDLLEEFVPKMKIVGAVPVVDKHGFMSQMVGVYDIRTNYFLDELKQLVEEFEKKDEVMIRVNTLRYFSGAYREIFDAKDFYVKSEVLQNEDKESVLRMWFTDGIGIRYMLPGIFGNRFSQGLKLDVKKKGLMVKSKGGLIPMFYHE